MFTEMPKSYTERIEKMTDFFMTNYKDKLLLFTLTGSGAYGKVLENSSDIDFLVILKEATIDDYKNIFNFKQSLNMKTDMIIHTLFEVENLYLTFVGFLNLHLINIGNIKPIYIDKTFHIDIPIDRIHSSLKENISFCLIRIKRIVYDYQDINPQLLLKTLGYTLKNYLALQNIFSENLYNTIDCFGNLTGIKMEFDFIKARTGNINQEEYQKLINYVDKIITYFDNLILENN